MREMGQLIHSSFVTLELLWDDFEMIKVIQILFTVWKLKTIETYQLQTMLDKKDHLCSAVVEATADRRRAVTGG